MTKGVIFFAQSEDLSIWGDISAWTNTLEKLGVDFYITIDEQKIIPNWVESKNIEGYRADNFKEALAILERIHPECETVFLTMDTTTEVKDFTHPKNACYIVGADSGTNPIFSPDHKVKIFSPNLWAIQCITVVIYDRFSRVVR